MTPTKKVRNLNYITVIVVNHYYYKHTTRLVQENPLPSPSFQAVSTWKKKIKTEVT